MSHTMAVIMLALSVGLNAVLLGRAAKRRRDTRHVHTWTPWSDWRNLRLQGSTYTAFFQRVRYCVGCAQEEQQNVGEHSCSTRDRYNTLSCTHRELYTAIFDPLYEFRQLSKDLEELE